MGASSNDRPDYSGLSHSTPTVRRYFQRRSTPSYRLCHAQLQGDCSVIMAVQYMETGVITLRLSGDV